ncbi:hypothetical protein [Streptomyces sp. NPDC030920]|uniref:hypothetical protein n=1 Tax=Streptomyces sp. NPDC030920 TaxID=3365308 RepID=UPI00384BA8F4
MIWLISLGRRKMASPVWSRSGGLVLPQPVVPALDVVEAEMPVAVRVDQVGGEGQIVRARLPGLFLLAQRILRRRSVIQK